MKNLTTTTTKGKAPGTILKPHLFADGMYVVSMTRFEKDYIHVRCREELHQWVLKGYRVRMSNPVVFAHRAPSLISPRAIRFIS